MDRNRSQTGTPHSPHTGWRLSSGMGRLALPFRRGSSGKTFRSSRDENHCPVYNNRRRRSSRFSFPQNCSGDKVELNAAKRSVAFTDSSKPNEEFGSRENRGDSCVSRLTRQPTQWETYLEEKSRLTDPATRYIPLRGKLVFTYGLLFVCIFLMTQSCIVENGIAPWAVNRLLGPSAATLLRVGAPRGDDIRETGQWWRLLWGPFLHAGWLHILMNFVVWYQLGVMIEPDWGFLRTFAVFMLSAVTGSLMSATLSPAYISVGASGGIFGIMGACIPYVFEYWRTIPFPKCILYIMIVSLVLSFVTGFVPYVDNYAHLGGAIGGILSGFMTITKFELGSPISKDDVVGADKAVLKSGELASTHLILADSDMRRGSTCMRRGGSHQKSVLSRGNATRKGSSIKNGTGVSKVGRLDSDLLPSRLYEQGGGLVRSGQLIPRPRSGVLRHKTLQQRSAPVGNGTSEAQGGLDASDKFHQAGVGIGHSMNPEVHRPFFASHAANGLHPLQAAGAAIPNVSRSENLVTYCGKDQKPNRMTSFPNAPVVTRLASEPLLLSMDEEVGMAHIGNGLRSEVDPQLGRCYGELVPSLSSSVSMSGVTGETLSDVCRKRVADPRGSSSFCEDVSVSAGSKENLQHQELHCVVPISGFVRNSGSLRRRTSSVLQLALRISAPSAPQALVSPQGDAVVGSVWDGSAIEWNRASIGREKTNWDKNMKKEEHNEIVVFDRRWPSSSGSFSLESSCRLCTHETGAQEAAGPASRIKIATVMHTMDYPEDLALSHAVKRGVEEDNKEYEASHSHSHEYAQEGVDAGFLETDEKHEKCAPCVNEELYNEQDGVTPATPYHSSPYSNASDSPDPLVVVSEGQPSQRSSWGRLDFQAPAATATPEARTPRGSMSAKPPAPFQVTPREAAPEANGRQSRRTSQAGDTILYRLVTSERLLLTDHYEGAMGYHHEGAMRDHYEGAMGDHHEGAMRDHHEGAMRDHHEGAMRDHHKGAMRDHHEPALGKTDPPTQAPFGPQSANKPAVVPRDSGTMLDGLPAVTTPRVSFKSVLERSASAPKSTASTRDGEQAVLQSVMSRQFSKGVPSRPKTSVVQKDSVRRWKRVVRKIQKRFFAVDEKGCPKFPARMTVRHTSNVDIDDSFVWKSWKVWCIRIGSGTVLGIIWTVLIVLLGCPSCYTPPGRLSFV